MSIVGWVIYNEGEKGYLSEPDDTVYVDLNQAYRFKTQKEAQENIDSNDHFKNVNEVVKRLEVFVLDPQKNYSHQWLPIAQHPKKYGKYLVSRKDGSQHWVTWNGTGWSHGEGEWVRWFDVPEPPKEI